MAAATAHDSNRGTSSFHLAVTWPICHTRGRLWVVRSSRLISVGGDGALRTLAFSLIRAPPTDENSIVARALKREGRVTVVSFPGCLRGYTFYKNLNM